MITLTQDITVKELLSRCPETIPVFLRHHMVCVGCYMSGFDTLGEAAANYCLDWEPFLAELQVASDHCPVEAGGSP